MRATFEPLVDGMKTFKINGACRYDIRCPICGIPYPPARLVYVKFGFRVLHGEFFYICFFVWYTMFCSSCDSVKLMLHMALDLSQGGYRWGHLLNVIPCRAWAE